MNNIFILFFRYIVGIGLFIPVFYVTMTYYNNSVVQIYKGKFTHNQKSPKYSKVIVLDLDETLGEFSELAILWNYLPDANRTQDDFNKLLDMYPEFLRCGITTILQYLYHKKQKGHCSKIYLYTNNKYSPDIPNHIAEYFSHKIGPGLFDKVICAFKIRNKIIEPLRTTNEKCYSDFIHCTLLPKSTEICFIDDVFHEKMKHDKIYYIQPSPYIHPLSTSVIIERACEMLTPVFTPATLIDLLHIRDVFAQNQYEKHMKVSQKIMYYIKEFFYLSTMAARTKKSQKKTGKFTKKNYSSK